MVATINAHVPAPALCLPLVRTSVWGCTQRRRCVLQRPVQVLSVQKVWGALTSNLQQLNLIPTHHPQKAGHPGRSGVLVLKMEARVEAGTVRSCSRGPAAVQETAARAAPAPTVKSLVGPGANITFIPALPT